MVSVAEMIWETKFNPQRSNDAHIQGGGEMDKQLKREIKYESENLNAGEDSHMIM